MQHITDHASESSTETEIAAIHGDHMRQGATVRYTHPRTAETTLGVVHAVFYDTHGKAAAELVLGMGNLIGATAADLSPLRPDDLNDGEAGPRTELADTSQCVLAPR